MIFQGFKWPHSARANATTPGGQPHDQGPPAVPSEGQNKNKTKKKGWFYAESSVCKSPIFQVSDHTQRKMGFLLELFLPGPIVGIENRGFPRVQARRQRMVGGSEKETQCWSVTSPSFDFLPYTSCDYLLFRGLMVALCVLFRVFSYNQWERQESVSSSISAELEPQNFQK